LGREKKKNEKQKLEDNGPYGKGGESTEKITTHSISAIKIGSTNQNQRANLISLPDFHYTQARLFTHSGEK
jgi:hypothetical protein